MPEWLSPWGWLTLGAVLGALWARRRGWYQPSPSAYLSAADQADQADRADRAEGDALAQLARDDDPEGQLALGELFRKRGQIDQALHLHQHLLDTHLPSALVPKVRYELALDYLKAGVLDRAESLLSALAESGPMRQAALASQLSLAEQRREWRRAQSLAETLQSVSGSSLASVLAHHECELAELDIEAQDLEAAQQHLKRAAQLDPRSVRSSWMRGRLALQAEQWTDGLTHYNRALGLEARYFPDLFPALEQCLQHCPDRELVGDSLQALTEHFGSHPDFLDYQARQLPGDQRVPFLTEKLKAKPSLRLSTLLIKHASEQAALDPAPSETALAMAQALTHSLQAHHQRQPRYRCQSCGLTAGYHYWHCPGCKTWDSVLPSEIHS